VLVGSSAGVPSLRSPYYDVDLAALCIRGQRR
jgi:hypothetical protein